MINCTTALQTPEKSINKLKLVAFYFMIILLFIVQVLDTNILLQMVLCGLVLCPLINQEEV